MDKEILQDSNNGTVVKRKESQTYHFEQKKSGVKEHCA